MARGLKGTVYQNGPDGTTHAFPAGTTKADLPDWVVVDDGAFDAGEPEPVVVAITGDYGAHDKAALEVEVARRNAGRAVDEQVAVEGKGNKPDLVKALDADDQARTA